MVYLYRQNLDPPYPSSLYFEAANTGKNRLNFGSYQPIPHRDTISDTVFAPVFLHLSCSLVREYRSAEPVIINIYPAGNFGL